MNGSEYTTPRKKCSKCGRELPATLEFFHAGERYAGGLRSRCKACQHAEHHRYVIANAEKVSEYSRGYKADNAERIAERRRVRDRENHDERMEWQRVYRAANAEKVAERAQIYRIDHRDQIAKYRQAYHAAHVAESAEYARAYNAAHPDAARAHQSRRRALKRGNGGTHGAADIMAQHERQRGRCYWCKARVSDSYHVDHVVPLSLGGSNGPENLVVACPTCNLSKGSKHPTEWAGRLL